MHRFARLARHVFVETPKIWWDFFLDMWADIGDAMLPETLDRSGDYPDVAVFACDGGEGE